MHVIDPIPFGLGVWTSYRHDFPAGALHIYAFPTASGSGLLLCNLHTS